MTDLEREAKVSALTAELAFVRAVKHEKHDTLTNAEERAITLQIRNLSTALVATITEGARPCPTCKAAPHGMAHMVLVRKTETPVFEIGCLACRDHRAQGFTVSMAVGKWNQGPKGWMAPSPGPGVVLDQSDSD